MGRSLPRSGIRLTADNYANFMRQIQQADQALTRFQQTAQRSVNPQLNTSQLRQQLRQVEQDANNAGGRSGSAFGGSFGSNVSNLIGSGFFLSLGAAAGNAFIGAFTRGFGEIKKAFDDATSFQQNVANVSALSGVDAGNADAVAAVQDQIAKVVQQVATSPDVVVGLDSASSVASSLLKTGQDLEAINNGLLKSTVQFQNATADNVQSLTEYGNAADIVGRGLQLFNLDVQDSERFINGATAVITGSAIKSLTDYRYALVNSAQAIQLLGLDVDEFNASIIATSASFSSGRTAGTSLEAMLTRLANRTEDADDALAELGITAFDAQGQFVGLENLQRQLAASFERGFNQEELLNLLSRAFGSVGAGMAQALGNADDFAGAMDKVATTSAAAIAGIKTDTLQTKLSNLGDIAQALGVSFASPFVEDLEPAVSAASVLLNALVDDVERLGNAFSAVLGPAVDGVVLTFNALAVQAGTSNLDALRNTVDSQIGYLENRLTAALDNPLTIFTGTDEAVAGFQELSKVLEGIDNIDPEIAPNIVGLDSYIDRISQITAESIRSANVSGEALGELRTIYGAIEKEIVRVGEASVTTGEEERQQLADSIALAKERAASQFEARAIKLAPDIGTEGATDLLKGAQEQLESELSALEESLAQRGLFYGPEVTVETGAIVDKIYDSLVSATAEAAEEASGITLDVPIALSESLGDFSGLSVAVQEQYAGIADSLFQLQDAYATTGALTEEQQAQLLGLLTTTQILSENSLGLATSIDLLAQSETFAATGSGELITALVDLETQYAQGQIGVAEYGLALEGLVAKLLAVVQAAGITDSAVLGVIGNLQTAAATAASGVRNAGGDTPGAAAAADARVEAAALRQQRRQRALLADAQAQSAKSGAKAVKNVESVLGQIEGLFSLSKVTKEDLLAAEQGNYVDKADEFVRQLEDYVVNGNKEFEGRLGEAKQALERVGVDTSALAPDQVLAQIKDGWANQWLFSAKENVKLINQVAVESAAAMKAKSEEGRKNIIEAFGGLIDDSVSAIQTGLSGGGGGSVAAPSVPNQDDLDAQINTLDFTYIEDVLATSLSAAVTNAFGSVDFGAIISGSIGGTSASAEGGEATPLQITDFWMFEKPETKIPLSVFDYWEVSGADQKALIDLSSAVQFAGAAGAARIDLSRSLNFIGSAGSQNVDLANAVTFTGSAGKETIDLSTLVDFIGTLPNEEVNRAELVEFINAIPTEDVDRTNLVKVLGQYPDETINRDNLITFTGAIPTEDVNRADLINVLGQYPSETIDRAGLIDFINTLPTESVDRDKLITFANALPTEEVDRGQLIGFINALPTESVDRANLITFANELPTEDVDRQALVDFINTLPTESIDRQALVGFINELPTETVDREGIVDFIGTLPVEEIDISKTITFAGTVPSRNINLGEIVTYSGDPTVTPPISTSGTAGATTVTAGEPLPVTVENPDAITGDQRFALPDNYADPNIEGATVTGETTITGPVTMPDSEEQRDILDKNKELIELAGDILENWDDVVTEQKSAAASTNGTTGLGTTETQAEVAKIQALGNESALTKNDVDALGTSSTETAGEIADAGEDVISTFDDVSETSGNVIEELRGWEGALNTSTTKIDDFGTALGELDFTGFGKSLTDLVDAVRYAAGKITDAVDSKPSDPEPSDPTSSSGSSALGGRASGNTLVGEDGAELWYNPFSHESGVVGRGGAEIVRFDPGTYVVPAAETQRILRRSTGEKPLPDMFSAALGTGLSGLSSLFHSTPPGISSGGLSIPREDSSSRDRDDPRRLQNDDSLLRELQNQIANTQDAVASLFDAAGVTGTGGANAYSRSGGRSLANSFLLQSSGGLARPGDTTINITNNIDNSVQSTTNNYALTAQSLRSTESVEADFRIMRNQAR